VSIEYRIGNQLDLEAVHVLYEESTLGERRPIHNPDILRGMIEHASLIITAWDGGRLIGISRLLTDFVYVAYLADLAVHREYQRQGIGTALIQKSREALAPTCFLTLLSAPLANEYYPRLGFYPHPRAWCMDPSQSG
jgi:predicted N-acetyltransferase YhbS